MLLPSDVRTEVQAVLVGCNKVLTQEAYEKLDNLIWGCELLEEVPCGLGNGAREAFAHVDVELDSSPCVATKTKIGMFD